MWENVYPTMQRVCLDCSTSLIKLKMWCFARMENFIKNWIFLIYIKLKLIKEVRSFWLNQFATCLSIYQPIKLKLIAIKWIIKTLKPFSCQQLSSKALHTGVDTSKLLSSQGFSISPLFQHLQSYFFKSV
jgi:hypothetical protein